ncbi:hypothetical protein LTR28_003345, partial [Elasticomyces elasticus]
DGAAPATGARIPEINGYPIFVPHDQKSRVRMSEIDSQAVHVPADRKVSPTGGTEEMAKKACGP